MAWAGRYAINGVVVPSVYIHLANLQAKVVVAGPSCPGAEANEPA
jgi:hypothetical protein